ncbi:hypothetical protein PLICRDRAFT_32883 [Plicaturopsis crispa FD-325 SS-3]|uniref:MYND-type domain-containing protein n=1 Tax=Plicaturopsis crispa FD-325 SS-3 TaxID=944288 RepID=A0A0C9SW90_PLICR|nr:hypothetical protein PLICRDRAFT_32883 [Plicaturopsis crispa FD-325 SS-3]
MQHPDIVHLEKRVELASNAKSHLIYDPLLQIFFGNLTAKPPVSNTPSDEEGVTLAKSLVSLNGLVVPCFRADVTKNWNRRKYYDDLGTHWPSIRKWLEFFTRFLTAPHVLAVTGRVLILGCITNFLPCISDDITFHGRVKASGFRPLTVMAKLWALESSNHNFQMNGPHSTVRLTPSTFSRYLVSFTAELPHCDYEANIFRPLEKTPDDITTLILANVASSFDVGWHSTPGSLPEDIEVLTTMSLTRTLTLTKATAATGSGRMARRRADCIAACCRFLSQWLGNNGCGDILLSLDADLMYMLARADRPLSCLEDYTSGAIGVIENPYRRILETVLPKYTIYRSVLHRLNKCLADERVRALEKSMTEKGHIRESWCRLKDIIRERLSIDGLSRTNHDEFLWGMRCANVECTNTYAAEDLKRCDNCQEVFFCSSECLKHEWKNGTHRVVCKDTAAHLATGAFVRLSIHDHDYINQVVKPELNALAPQITLFLKISGTNVPCVVFNFNEFPVESSIGTVVTNRPANYSANAYVRARWDHVVREVERAHLTGGNIRAVTQITIPEQCGSRNILTSVAFEWDSGLKMVMGNAGSVR